MKKCMRGRAPPEKERTGKRMKAAERAVRLLCTAGAALGAVLLLLPVWGIRADMILSGSMEPVLKTGGIVFTDTGRKTPEIGDVITYSLGDSYVTHRVVRKEDGCFVTKGDRNVCEDAEKVEPSQIEGIVVFSLPLLGYAAAFLQEKTVFCLLLLMLVQELVFLVIQWRGERGKKCAGK